MGNRWAAGGCGCCDPVECLAGWDYFDRTAGTVTDWDELTGSWEIVAQSDYVPGEVSGTGRLRCTAAGVALLPDVTFAGSSQVASALLIGRNLGDRVRVVVGAIDEDNYLAGELEYSIDCGILRAIKVVAGVETVLDEVILGGVPLELTVSLGVTEREPYTLWVCAYGGQLTVTAHYRRRTNATPVTIEMTAQGTASPAGNRGGLAATVVGVNGADFGSFAMYNAGPAECSYVLDECGSTCLIVDDFFKGYGRTVMGCGWDVLSGTWGPGVTTSALALAVHVAQVEPGEGMQVLGTATNSVARAIVDYLDSSNYHYFEVDSDKPLVPYRYRVVRVAGGAETVLYDVYHSLVAADRLKLDVVACNNNLVVPSLGMVFSTTLHGGRRAGLGTGVRNSLDGDHPTGNTFSIERFRLNRVGDDCLDCQAILDQYS